MPLILYTIDDIISPISHDQRQMFCSRLNRHSWRKKISFKFVLSIAFFIRAVENYSDDCTSYILSEKNNEKKKEFLMIEKKYGDLNVKKN